MNTTPVYNNEFHLLAKFDINFMKKNKNYAHNNYAIAKIQKKKNQEAKRFKKKKKGDHQLAPSHH